MVCDGCDVIRVTNLSANMERIGSISFGYHGLVREDWSQS